MIFNVLALTPLLERFESEYGTLTSLAMFFGRKYQQGGMGAYNQYKRKELTVHKP
jgi:hypothetical protein